MSRRTATGTATATPAAGARDGGTCLRFDDNALMSALCGAHDANLARLEQKTGATIHARGNRLTVTGPEDARVTAVSALKALYKAAGNGGAVAQPDVDAAIRMAARPPDPEEAAEDVTIRTPKRTVRARSPGQAAYVRALRACEMTFGLGPAGTGKTYLAVACAVSMMQSGQVERLILSRPAVEAGERLGFLPGDLREKVDPYLRPLYDALYEMLPGDRVAKKLESGEIEVAPLAFMRGRTLSSAFIILDEAQNTTPMQMKMLLTRLGENSRMVVTGDLSQVDLPRGVRSGLRDAVEIMDGMDGVGFVHFGHVDVVRHDLVSRIVQAYDARDNAQGRLNLEPEEDAQGS